VSLASNTEKPSSDGFFVSVAVKGAWPWTEGRGN